MAQFPNTTAADGIWNLKQIRRSVLGNTWPGSGITPISDLFDITIYLDATSGNDSNNGTTEATAVQTLAGAYTRADGLATGSEQILLYMADGTYTTNLNVQKPSGSANHFDLANFQTLGECHFMSQNPGGATLRWVHDSSRDSLVSMDWKQQQQIHFIGLIIEGDTLGSQPGNQYDMTLVNDGGYSDSAGNEAIGDNICTFNNCKIQTEDTNSSRYYSYGYFNAYNYGRYPFRLLYNNCLFDMPQVNNWSNGSGSECGHIGSGITGTTSPKSWGVIPTGYNNMDTCTTSATTAILNAGDFNWTNYPQYADSFVFP